MTENLLHKLEEKMMMLLSEVEDLRKEVQHLKRENLILRSDGEKYIIEKTNHEKKLHDLISLLDAINVIDSAIVNNADIAA